MRIIQDYRTCVGVSLSVMHDLREKICKDSRIHYSVIYSGLHEPDSDLVRNLYFQSYEMEWLDRHWEVLDRLLKQHKQQYRKSEQQDITLFFAKYFSDFMSEVDMNSQFAKVAIHELIIAQKETIEQMITYADKWEEQNNQLKVNLKKHKEHFKRLIESGQNESAEEERKNLE